MGVVSIVLLLSSAALFGAMLLFTLIVAPLVHSRLPAAEASQFLRAVFPRYYLFNGLLALVATLVAWQYSLFLFTLALLVLAGFVVAGGYLLPAINRARERRAQGEEAAQRFATLHRASVVVNLAQLLLLALILVRLSSA